MLFHDKLKLIIFASLPLFAMTGCITAGKQQLDKSPSKQSSQRNADISHLTEEVARESVISDWQKFDRSTHVVGIVPAVEVDYPMEGSGIWYARMTPPFPDVWPPKKKRSFSYYAYAEAHELLMHGPREFHSAPWAKVVLTDGESPKKELLSQSIIYAAVPFNVMRRTSPSQADRLAQIENDGEASLPTLLSWTGLPTETDDTTKVIKEYYCQWTLEHEAWVTKYIRDNHKEFFKWLSCPKLAPGDK